MTGTTMMIGTTIKTRIISGAAFGLMMAGNIWYSSQALAAAEDAKIVSLTQIGCQFLESENGINHGYSPKSADDCKKINAASGGDRLKAAKPLVLKPGKYVFRVTNKNVPYQLGFWLREKGYSSLTPWKQSVSGGGLFKGKCRDYEITLKAGQEYVYSCPLNPTPDYRIVVK